LKWHEVLSGGVHTLMMPWYMKKPVIASVQGYAVGGGSELAMFCDLVVASETAKFGEPEVRFSQAGPAFVLPHLVGQKRARELLYFGDMISAKKAYEYGLINRLVSEDGDLQAETRKYAERLALIDIETLTTIKRAFVRSADISGFKDSIHAGLDLVAPLYAAKTEVNSQFVQIAREDGLREALKWRNSQFEEK